MKIRQNDSDLYYMNTSTKSMNDIQKATILADIEKIKEVIDSDNKDKMQNIFQR